MSFLRWFVHFGAAFFLLDLAAHNLFTWHLAHAFPLSFVSHTVSTLLAMSLDLCMLWQCLSSFPQFKKLFQIEVAAVENDISI